MSPLLAGMLVFAFGAIVAITLTPGSGEFFGRSWCGGLRPPPRLGQLVSISSEHGLNVLLFVPLGILIGLIPRVRPFAVAAVIAGSMPIVIEWIQYSVPRLDRICQTWDALENLMGLVLGLGHRRGARVRPSDRPPDRRMMAGGACNDPRHERALQVLRTRDLPGNVAVSVPWVNGTRPGNSPSPRPAARGASIAASKSGASWQRGPVRMIAPHAHRAYRRECRRPIVDVTSSRFVVVR